MEATSNSSRLVIIIFSRSTSGNKSQKSGGGGGGLHQSRQLVNNGFVYGIVVVGWRSWQRQGTLLSSDRPHWQSGQYLVLR